MPTAALTLTSPQSFPHHLPSSKGPHLLHLPSEKSRPSRISTKHNIICYNNPRHVWASISKLNKAIQQELKHSTRRQKSQRQPLITARSLAKTPGYSAITYMQRIEVRPLQTPWSLPSPLTQLILCSLFSWCLSLHLVHSILLLLPP